MTKKFSALFLCFCLLFSYCLAVSAATTPTITISNKTAQPGDEVTIDISITNNPGIMAMAFCITYDSEALEYTGYKKGYLSKYTVKDHPDKGHIAFVNDESSDKSNDGVIVSVKFKAKDTAKAKKYTITLANLDRKKYGNKLYKSFSNSNLENIEPIVKSGSITVAETCENSGHKYGQWTVITPADCTNTGSKTHTCTRCQFSETIEIPITHDFEAEWTIDKAATPEEDGVMSRHCKNCDEVTDKITFSYQEIGGDNNDDTSSDDTISDTPSDDNSSSDVPSDNTSSDNISSNESVTTSGSDADNTSSNSSGKPEQSPKPNINNQVGEKVPQQEAEKLENYQPPKTDDDTSSDTTTPDNDTSSAQTESSDTTINPTDDKTNQDDEDIYYETDYTTFIIYILLGALSLGIIILFIIIIVRRKHEN